MKMIIMRGLPASGKSTEAERLVKSGGYMRVNRDKLREMMHFNNWTPKNEAIIIEAEYAVAKEILDHGYNVIIDDTNLSDKHVDSWKYWARKWSEGEEIQVEVRDMMKNVTVKDCLTRDANREKFVGLHVIMNMAMEYGYLDTKKIVVCDIDGTVADCSHRLQYAKGETKDWGKFFSLLSEDTPRMDVYTKAYSTAIDSKAELIFVSARPEDYRMETEHWLRNNGMIYSHLIMRRKGDKRDDTEVKSDIYNKYLKRYEIVKVYDDRPKVIRMWREKGLEVEDVGEGKEF